MAARASAAEIPSGGDDERLLIEAAKADPQRFGALYERNFDRVYAYIARRSGSRGEAEDLTSEVFHQALANLGRFEWRGVPFAAWLLQIARNAVADRWQRLARERGEPAPDPDVIGGPAAADRRAVLTDLLGRLPHDQQRVVWPASSSRKAFARSPRRSGVRRAR
jgi:RNA polymerase sigma-70 factor (ECF subfamily)